MSESDFFDLSIIISFWLMTIAFILTFARLVLGPTLPDRVLSLDILMTLAIGFIAIFTLLTGFYAYLDMAIALGLVGFLATIAFARFIINQASSPEIIDDTKDNIKTSTDAGSST